MISPEKDCELSIVHLLRKLLSASCPLRGLSGVSAHRTRLYNSHRLLLVKKSCQGSPHVDNTEGIKVRAILAILSSSP